MNNQLATKQISELGFTKDQLDLIKTNIAQGFSNDELAWALYQAKNADLDPLMKQVYFWKDQGKVIIHTGIDGYRLNAARSGEYGGMEESKFDGWEDEEHDKMGAWGHPISCLKVGYRIVQGQKSRFEVRVFWDEYYPGEGGRGYKWRKSPRTMIGKCAEGLLLRTAYPERLGNILVSEEIERAQAIQADIKDDRENRNPKRIFVKERILQMNLNEDGTKAMYELFDNDGMHMYNVFKFLSDIEDEKILSKTKLLTPMQVVTIAKNARCDIQHFQSELENITKQ